MRTLVIAEAGVNHNGELSRALQMIEVAADSGADIVKFQTFTAENLVTTTAAKANYQERETGGGTQLEMLKKLQLSEDDHHALMAKARQCGVRFFSTGFDLDSVRFLKSLNLGLWKIPSGEATNRPYLEMIAGFQEPTILSTGMCDFQEVEEAVEVLVAGGLSLGQITVLHCNTEYPTPMKDVNLRAMVDMGKKLNTPVGYSDHTLGLEVPWAAVALGATVIEKHFTLDRALPGPDHKSSLEPHELKTMVQGIRHVEEALGQSEKKVSASEKQNRLVARKSIVAKSPIKKGQVFSIENLTTKRPGSGLSPMFWWKLMGQKANKDYAVDDLIDGENL